MKSSLPTTLKLAGSCGSLLALLLCLQLATVEASAVDLTAVASAEIDRTALKRAVNPQVAAARRIAPQLGVEIYDLGTAETVYSYNHETERIVASNTKLFTTAAALDRLGPGFFFETEVLVRGDLRDGTLDGELAIVGGGDPNLSGRHHNGDSLAVFREWATALKERGINRIDGDVHLIDGLFDRQWIHPDWPRDQLSRWYEAPVSALSFNDNCVLVKVEPAARPGAPAVASTVPALDLFRIANSASTTARARDQWLAIDRRLDEDEVLTVSGRIYRRAESVDKWIAVPDPLRYFGAALRQALHEEGIRVAGEVRPAQRLDHPQWRPLLTHRTDLLTTLEVINKRSQNFYAESVLKLLGAKLCGEGSWQTGTRVVKEFLDEIGLDQSYRLADGSGMSRNNRFAPRHLIHLLEHMYHHRWSREFLATLPYSGERDLSWEKRLEEAPYRGNVLAKTGSLNGVSTLSGYAKARSGKVYAFSILLNGTSQRWRARDAQDAIVRALIDHG